MTSPDGHRASIRDRVARELAEPVRPSVEWLASEIAARHGDTVLGVLFYGSCLRKESDEGVLDYWVLVDDYDAAYGPGCYGHRLHAWVNRFAAPNVFFVQRQHDSGPLRTKYGVISAKDFARGTDFSAWHPYVWARFSQPARFLIARDDEARRAVEESVTEAILTSTSRLLCHLPDQAGLLRFSLAAFWREAFQRTYDSERRPEAAEFDPLALRRRCRTLRRRRRRLASTPGRRRLPRRSDRVPELVRRPNRAAPAHALATALANDATLRARGGLGPIAQDRLHVRSLGTLCPVEARKTYRTQDRVDSTTARTSLDLRLAHHPAAPAEEKPARLRQTRTRRVSWPTAKPF